MTDLEKNFILIQDYNKVEDLHLMFNQIYKTKEANKKQFMVNTGIKDEFNKDIFAYIPTIVIVDALPSLSIEEVDKNEELSQGTYANRVAKAVAAFYKQNMASVRKYNLIVFVINHITTKIEINPMAKTQPQAMYLKMDEALPGGVAPMYFAHNIVKIVSSDKKNKEKDGYDGFLARFELLKARTNKSGSSCEMIYDQEVGYDKIKTLYNLLDKEGFIEGRNPYRYIAGFPESKFDSRDIYNAIQEKPEILTQMDITAKNICRNVLSNIKFVPTDSNTDLIALSESLIASQEREDDEKK